MVIKGMPTKMMRDLVLIKKPREKIVETNKVIVPDSIVERQEDEQRMAGGAGEVVMMGPDVRDLEVGDMAVPKGYVGNAVETDDDKNWYIVIAEIDIMYCV